MIISCQGDAARACAHLPSGLTSARSMVDWPRLLGDVQYLLGDQLPENPEVRTPVGTPALAKYLAISRGTVRNLLDGTEPRFSEGQRLIAIWVRLTGKPVDHVPTTGRVLSAAEVRA